MRGVLLSLVFAVGLVFAAAPAQAAHPTKLMPSFEKTAPTFALQIPDKKIEITVGDKGVSARWYRNPMWIAIGVLAVIVLLLLIILAARGGGTTIIRQ